MSTAESAQGNAATYFVDSHIAAGRAGKLAFREVDGARRNQTYGELSEASSRMPGLSRPPASGASHVRPCCVSTPSNIRSFSGAR